ncbi:MAG TPA: hypothetical protein VHA71_11355 [Rhodanobacteraceae bacterium]|jgi:hypothetical protein|nr:hypothetical protein [Rhodanobacteraceae bacterium]
MLVKRCSLKEQLSDTWKIIFDLALILIAAAIGHFINDRGAIQGMLVGAVVGISLHWRATTKASVSIKNGTVPYAKKWIEEKGYTLGANGGEFIPSMHRLLRFDSQNIKFMRIDNSSTRMFGPYYMLKMFIKNI